MNMDTAEDQSTRLAGLRALKERGVETNWLIDGVLPANVIATLFAPSYAGKSFVALDWALSLASTRKTWQERTLMHGPVVFVVAENEDNAPARIAAWERVHGKLPDDTPIYFLLEPANLFAGPGDVQKLLAEIDALPEKPVLVVFDTLAQCMSGGNDRVDADMTRVIDSANQIRRTTGATVLIVHHTGLASGAQRRPRGATAFSAGCQTSILVERANLTTHLSDGDKVTLDCVKMSVGKHFDKITLPVCVVPVDDTGATSVAFADEQTAKPEPVQQARTRQSGDRLSADLILAALAEVGKPCGAAELTRHMGLDSKKRGAVQKMLERLADKGRVVLTGDGLYSVPSSVDWAA